MVAPPLRGSGKQGRRVTILRYTKPDTDGLDTVYGPHRRENDLSCPTFPCGLHGIEVCGGGDIARGLMHPLR